MRAAGEQRYLVAGASKLAAEVCADTAGSDDDESHEWLALCVGRQQVVHFLVRRLREVLVPQPHRVER